MKTSKHHALRSLLARRVRVIRAEKFGGDVESLAEALGIPALTWRNYEAGVTMPAEILLGFVEITRVRLQWLVTGDGDRYAGR